MSLPYLFRVELKRIAISKAYWVTAVLCVLSFLTGYAVSALKTINLMNNTYILYPVLSGTILGSIIWAVFAVYESDRVHRGKVDTITEAVISPVKTASARLLAFVTLSAGSCLICLLAYLPFTAIKLDYLFSFGLYAASFLILTLPIMSNKKANFVDCNCEDAYSK